MRVEVFDTLPALAARAVAHVGAAAGGAIARHKRFTVALSGGGTPAGMLAALAKQHLAWDRIHLFQVDERIAPDGHPDRNLEMVRERLVSRVPIPATNLHPMPVTEDDLDAAAERYAAELRRVCGDPPVLDLVHLGLGDDGHTASLFPGDPAADVMDRDVTVTPAHGGRRRMTLTLPALNRARQILWLIAGEDKGAAVARLVEGDRGMPAARVQPARALMLVDAAAAAAIRPADRTSTQR